MLAKLALRDVDLKEKRPWSSLWCVALLFLGLHGCAAIALVTGRFDPPAAELVASKVTSLSASGASLVFQFEVRNPNDFSLQAHTLAYRLKLGSGVVAQGEMEPAVTLPAKGVGVIDLPVRVDVEKLLQDAVAGLAAGEIPYQIDVTLALGNMLFEREIAITESSVLLLNLPLGLANGAPYTLTPG